MKMKMVAERRAIDKIFKRRDRYDFPDWQRDKVWDAARKRCLIDSILHGWKLPKFYFVKTSDGRGGPYCSRIAMWGHE
jgi:hypothetical protein